MNNGSSLNRSTINGWIGDVTIRIQILSVAIATGAVIGRAWRRSVVAGSGVVNATEGRVWRRSTVAAVAVASVTLRQTYLRWVQSAIHCVSQALSVITAIGKPQTPVSSPVNAISSAVSTSILGRAFRYVTIGGVAQSIGNVSWRVFKRSGVNGTASALGFIHDDVNRQIPWDEAAPEERRFLVPHEPHTFTVVN